MMTVTEIEDAPVAGNAHDDLSLWGSLDRIILDDSQPLAVRYAASRKVSDITGETYDESRTPEIAVAEHAAILLSTV